jgi:hypothetical protein
LAVGFVGKMAESSPLTVEESYGETEVVLPSGQKTYVPRPIQHASHRHRPDFAGWGKGPPIYLALMDVVGLSAGDHGDLQWRIRQSLPVNEKISVHSLQYSGGNIQELSLRALTKNSYEITARSGVPLKLKITLPGEKRSAHSLKVLGTGDKEVFVIQKITLRK